MIYKFEAKIGSYDKDQLLYDLRQTGAFVKVSSTMISGKVRIQISGNTQLQAKENATSIALSLGYNLRFVWTGTA